MLLCWDTYFFIGCRCPGNSGATLRVNRLKIINTSKPKTTEPTIKRLLVRPVTEKDSLMRIVDITNPELRMMDWNWSE